jgi:hypothetical protein
VIDWAKEISAYENIGPSPNVKLGPLLANIGSAVANAVETSIGSPIDEAPFTEAYDGNEKRVLFLRHTPIVKLLSASVNGTALVIDDPLVDPVYPPPQLVVPGVSPFERFRIVLTDGTCFGSGLRNVIVSYIAGWQAAPGLVFACAKWAAGIFRDRDRLGIQSQGFAGQSTTYTRKMPEDVALLLQPYRPAIVPPL